MKKYKVLPVCMTINIFLTILSFVMSLTFSAPSLLGAQLSDCDGLKARELVYPAHFDAPFIEFEQNELTPINLHGAEYKGRMNDGIFAATFHGHGVIVKRFDLSNNSSNLRPHYTEAFADEVAMTKRLSELKVAPEFFGVTAISNGVFGIVTKRIFPSFFLKFTDHKTILQAKQAASVELLKKWIKRIKEIEATILKEEIYASDLQMLLTNEGEVYLVDFGLYKNSSQSAAQYTGFKFILKVLEE